LTIAGGVPIRDLPEGFTTLSATEIAGIPLMVAVSVLLFVLAFAVLRWSRLGRYIYALGGNAEATRLAGVGTGRVTVAAYALCSLFTAVGAVFLTARVHQGQPTLGEDLMLQSIAAAVLGGVSLFGGRGSVVGVAFGVLFISVLSNGMNLLNVSSYAQMLVIGVALIAAVAVERLLAVRSGER
jgi:ribose transport system permease protein